MKAAEVENVLHYVPIIMRSAEVSEWERQFCISIAGRMKRGAFSPSDKQLGVLKRLVDRFKEANLRFDVIEDEARDIAGR